MVMTPKASRHQASGRLLIHPGPKKIGQVRSNVKTMLICFFDTQGTVHREFVLRGQTVNQQFYLGGFERTEGEGAEDKAGIVANGQMIHSP